MDMEFHHIPVLLHETIEGLNIKEDGIYVDCTLGGAGHSSEILKRLGPEGRLIGIDQDEDALKKAEEVLQDPRVTFVKGNFRILESLLDEIGVDKVDGVLMDIGVSSYQFDEGDRGFSYRKDAELDMRMDTSQPKTAKDIVNLYPEEELTRIFLEYSEEKWAARIAKFICERRKEKEIETTFELVEIIKSAIPKAVRREGGHPAKRVFQALRIEVNEELDALKEAIDAAINRLNKKGRLAIITFHSLEDRIVKTAFKEKEKGCICPPEFPVCVCNKKSEIKIITKKPITASEEELKRNRRSHSAKLRICQKK